jgi:hypothetical protein
MEQGVEEAEKEWSAEDDAVLRGIGIRDSGNDARMEDAVEEGGSGEGKTD